MTKMEKRREPLWVTGNTAKLYCADWIADYVREKNAEVRILDLGSGASLNFVKLLEAFPRIRYVGVEPSSSECDKARRALEGLNARIVNDMAYEIEERLEEAAFDLVVSFSVFEHVRQRSRYLRSAEKCLADGGRFLINYDAGHFVYPSSMLERIKNLVGPLLGGLGIERYYQRFVSEDEFRSLVVDVGLEIEEAKSFNTILKGMHKSIPEERRDEHMARWYDYERWLNEAGPKYTDRLAKLWTSRNFILRKR